MTVLRVNSPKYFVNQDLIESESIHLIKYYRICISFFEVYESKWSIHRLNKLMNDFILLTNEVKAVYPHSVLKEKYHKIKVNSFWVVFGFSVHQIIVLISLLWSLGNTMESSMWFGYVYFNIQYLFDALYFFYVTSLLKILTLNLNGIQEIFEEFPETHLKMLLEVQNQVRNISKNIVKVHEIKIVLHLLVFIISFGCSMYIAFVTIFFGSGALKFIVYLIFSFMPLMMIFKFCWDIDKLQERIQNSIERLSMMSMKKEEDQKCVENHLMKNLFESKNTSACGFFDVQKSIIFCVFSSTATQWICNNFTKLENKLNFDVEFCASWLIKTYTRMKI
uniref:Gustatory receptor n=1 Tax=Culicoides sonorensis TaxID=179676 RepID=A0A336M8C9_CULSO